MPVLHDLAQHHNVGVLEETATLAVQDLKPLFDRLQVRADALSDRICPVELPCGQCQVLVLAGHAHDDQARALLLAIRQAGLVLATPALLVVPPSVLGEIGRRLRDGQARPETPALTVTTPRHVLLAVLDDLVGWALRADASDIHVTLRHGQPTVDVAFTVNGACVRPVEFQSITYQTAAEVLSVAWMSVRGGNGAVFDPAREQQGRLDRSIRGANVGLRWASLATQTGPSVCLRLLARPGQRQISSLDSLGYTDEQLECLYRARLLTGGAVVFAGKVGSGKSTTLAALVGSIPCERKVITLEDPIEYPIRNALQCLVSGLDANSGSEDFLLKLKTIKRSAAHDVLVGEIRDVEGGRAVTDLVLSGVNVYTTIHGSSALHILLRLSSSLIGIPESLIAMPGVLKLLVYQALVRRLCERCALTAQEWLKQLPLLCALGQPRSVKWAMQWLERSCLRLSMDKSALRFRNTGGCRACRCDQVADQHGYRGRQLLAEMLEPSQAGLFHGALATNGLHAQVAQWQAACAGTGQCEIPGYVPIRQTAIAQLQIGRLDLRDFESAFGGVI